MNLELFKDGCLLMIIGMGFVFVFIQLMIWFMQINAKIIEWINKKYPEIVEETKYKKSSDDNDQIALAILCAYLKHKLNK